MGLADVLKRRIRSRKDESEEDQEEDIADSVQIGDSESINNTTDSEDKINISVEEVEESEEEDESWVSIGQGLMNNSI